MEYGRLRFIGGNKMLGYTCTNENLKAIVTGLDIQSTDRVLAVAGSGDQALAILETASFVKAVDIVQDQVDFFRGRVQALVNGDYNAFLNVNNFGTCDGFVSGTYMPEVAKFMLDMRNKYFLEGNRLKRIQTSLGNLVILNHKDILEVAQTEEGFSKIYLSNVFGNTHSNYWPISETLRNIALRLPVNGLIYVSNHDSLSETCKTQLIDWKFGDKRKNKDLHHIILGEIEDASFLPSQLCLDVLLTRQIRAHRFQGGIWRPAVYRRK